MGPITVGFLLVFTVVVLGKHEKEHKSHKILPSVSEAVAFKTFFRRFQRENIVSARFPTDA